MEWIIVSPEGQINEELFQIFANHIKLSYRNLMPSGPIQYKYIFHIISLRKAEINIE